MKAKRVRATPTWAVKDVDMHPGGPSWIPSNIEEDASRSLDASSLVGMQDFNVGKVASSDDLIYKSYRRLYDTSKLKNVRVRNNLTSHCLAVLFGIDLLYPHSWVRDSFDGVPHELGSFEELVIREVVREKEPITNGLLSAIHSLSSVMSDLMDSVVENSIDRSSTVYKKTFISSYRDSNPYLFGLKGMAELVVRLQDPIKGQEITLGMYNALSLGVTVWVFIAATVEGGAKDVLQYNNHRYNDSIRNMFKDDDILDQIGSLGKLNYLSATESETIYPIAPSSLNGLEDEYIPEIILDGTGAIALAVLSIAYTELAIKNATLLPESALEGVTLKVTKKGLIAKSLRPIDDVLTDVLDDLRRVGGVSPFPENTLPFNKEGASGLALLFNDSTTEFSPMDVLIGEERRSLKPLRISKHTLDLLGLGGEEMFKDRIVVTTTGKKLIQKGMKEYMNTYDSPGVNNRVERFIASVRSYPNDKGPGSFKSVVVSQYLGNSPVGTATKHHGARVISMTNITLLLDGTKPVLNSEYRSTKEGNDTMNSLNEEIKKIKPNIKTVKPKKVSKKTNVSKKAKKVKSEKAESPAVPADKFQKVGDVVVCYVNNDKPEPLRHVSGEKIEGHKIPDLESGLYVKKGKKVTFFPMNSGSVEAMKDLGIEVGEPTSTKPEPKVKPEPKAKGPTITTTNAKVVDKLENADFETGVGGIRVAFVTNNPIFKSNFYLVQGDSYIKLPMNVIQSQVTGIYVVRANGEKERLAVSSKLLKDIGVHTSMVKARKAADEGGLLVAKTKATRSKTKAIKKEAEAKVKAVEKSAEAAVAKIALEREALEKKSVETMAKLALDKEALEKKSAEAEAKLVLDKEALEAKKEDSKSSNALKSKAQNDSVSWGTPTAVIGLTAAAVGVLRYTNVGGSILAAVGGMYDYAAEGVATVAYNVFGWRYGKYAHAHYNTVRGFVGNFFSTLASDFLGNMLKEAVVFKPWVTVGPSSPTPVLANAAVVKKGLTFMGYRLPAWFSVAGPLMGAGVVLGSIANLGGYDTSAAWESVKTSFTEWWEACFGPLPDPDGSWTGNTLRRAIGAAKKSMVALGAFVALPFVAVGGVLNTVVSFIGEAVGTVLGWIGDVVSGVLDWIFG